MTPKKTLKKWFSNFMKPVQEHFAEWIDSYWHKSEQIPMSKIDGLSTAIENTVSAKQLLNHLDDTNAHHALFEELKRQIQALQTILQVDDVNLDTLQEIVTELKANTKLQELIDKKVNKEDGKGLSTNDFTNEHKQKLEGLQPTDVSGLLPKGGYDGTGQELKDAIDGLQTKIGQVETTLSVDDTAFDTLQEIVTQVKSNKNLESLLAGKLDKNGEVFVKMLTTYLPYVLVDYRPTETGRKAVMLKVSHCSIDSESSAQIYSIDQIDLVAKTNINLVTTKMINIGNNTSKNEYIGIKTNFLEIQADKFTINGRDFDQKIEFLEDKLQQVNSQISSLEEKIRSLEYRLQMSGVLQPEF